METWKRYSSLTGTTNTLFADKVINLDKTAIRIIYIDCIICIIIYI